MNEHCDICEAELKHGIGYHCCERCLNEIERFRECYKPKAWRTARGDLVFEYYERHVDYSLGAEPDDERIAGCERIAHFEPGTIKQLIAEIGGDDE